MKKMTLSAYPGLFIFFGFLTAGSPAAIAGDLCAVQVEKVSQSSPAERAGIKVGDVIERWSSSKGSGLIESPLDLEFVESEQAPLGEVELFGKREQQPEEWTIRSEIWGMIVRPNIKEPYQAEFAPTDDRTLAAWSLMRAAETLYRERKWEQSRNSYCLLYTSPSPRD